MTPKSITYIGAGGNIGSHAVGMVARVSTLGRLTIVDGDVYEADNLSSQAIEGRDVGYRKVDVLARRLLAINPRLQVVPIAGRVEDVPLAKLRADVIASGLDTRAARCTVNRVARRLGIPWVDAGVRAEGRLVRIDVFGPSPDEACFECGWGPDDYGTLEQSYPCSPVPAAAPSDAPAYLGGLAAALQVAECHKLLCGEPEHVLFGRQVLMESIGHRHFVSARRRAADCRFDHQRWRIEPLGRAAGAISLRRAIGLAGASSAGTTRLRMEGHGFARRLVCLGCGDSQEVLRLTSRLAQRGVSCRRCGGEMAASGFDTTDALSFEDSAGASGAASLYALGMRAGDVFSLEWPSGENHFEIEGR